MPAEDPAVYDMIGHADTMGVFQIESRAQMAMLPRLQPQSYYDLVIEVAIIRPGPIQGDMVHPYLRRRAGLEAVSYPSEAVADVLKRTLGVPIFQEQVMQLAIVAAGFTPGEADQLRRAMAAWKRKGGLGPFEERLIRGMRERGYSEEFARRIFQQILGFGEYGFPESHAASFALLVYVSAWLKRHEPGGVRRGAHQQPADGFLRAVAAGAGRAPARRRGASRRRARERWDCTLEPQAGAASPPALRLGLRLVKGLSAEAAGATRRGARRARRFESVQQLAERARARPARTRLPRRGRRARPGSAATGIAPRGTWPAWSRPCRCCRRCASPKAYRCCARRARARTSSPTTRTRGSRCGAIRSPCCGRNSSARGVLSSAELRAAPHGSIVRTAGLVITRQRPGSASGVTFVTLEDEFGYINLIVWRDVAERQRRPLVAHGCWPWRESCRSRARSCT